MLSSKYVEIAYVSLGSSLFFTSSLFSFLQRYVLDPPLPSGCWTTRVFPSGLSSSKLNFDPLTYVYSNVGIIPLNKFLVFVLSLNNLISLLLFLNISLALDGLTHCYSIL